MLSTSKEHHTCGTSGLDSLHELGTVLDETSRAKDVNADTASDLPCNGDESIGHKGGTSSKCLKKCPTSPIHSLPLPTAPKLVSAMKGTREKEGMPLKKLSVSWAPDVYDPPPTSVSHYPKKKTQQKVKSNKKHGKGKQKGKNMRGAKNKKQYQYHEIGGKSNKCVDTYTDTERAMPGSDYGSSLELLKFTVEERDEIGCPESNCGSSYRGNGGNTLRFAYAEAT